LFSCRGFVFRREFALLTFSDESFGRLAFHRLIDRILYNAELFSELGLRQVCLIVSV